MSGAPRRPGAGKVLRVSSRGIVGKRCVTWKCIRAAEQPREKVEDTIEIKVEPKFPVAATLQIRDVIDKLNSLDGRLARAEGIAADVQVCARARPDDCFRRVAVSKAGFFVARQLHTQLVHNVIREG